MPRIEITAQVFESVEDFPISMEEAKKLRLQLMEERKCYIIDQTSNFEKMEFSLCEH